MANGQVKSQYSFTGVFKGYDCGDYCRLVFKDDNGKEWDFGQGDNNLAAYRLGIEKDDGMPASNPK